MKDNDTFGWLSTGHRKKLVLMIAAILMVCILECVRLGVIMTVKSEYYMQKADELHQRERRIKAKRGRILDRNGEILAANEVVCTVSVIHSQIEDEDKVIKVLAGELDMDVEEVTKKVKKVSSMEYIKTNVAKDIGDAIREYDLRVLRLTRIISGYIRIMNWLPKCLALLVLIIREYLDWKLNMTHICQVLTVRFLHCLMQGGLR